MRAALIAAALALPAVHAADLALSNSSLEVRLDAESRGAIRSFVDRGSGRNFVAAAKPAALFRLTVADAGKTRELGPADAGSWDHSERQGEIVLRYRKLGGLDLDVECRVALSTRDGLSRWRMAVENRSAAALRTALYPVVLAPRQLGPQWEDDRILSPGNPMDGELRISQGPKMPFPGGSRALYPGRAQVQFVAYFDRAAGLYLAAYDAGGRPKRLGFLTTPAGIDLSFQHEIWQPAGAGWDMPYDVVMGAFRGDWHAAADIYKEWAHRQPWCSRKLTERADVPEWYREGRPVFMFIPRGGEYYPEGQPPRAPDLYRSRPPLPSPGLRPRAPALFTEVSRALASPVVVIEYGWEKEGMWVNPDVFPPYGGEDVFGEQVRSMRRGGHTMGAYISGTHWSLKKPGRDEYDGWAAFRAKGLAAAAAGEDQEPVINKSPWSTNARLCIASPLTQKIMLGMVRGLVERGVVFVQYDQNVGGEVYACHNRAHAHPGGLGTWGAEKTREFLQAARKLGKSVDPNFALTIEEPCEYFIQDVDGFNDRPYVTRTIAESVPLFGYLYHQYQVSFGGDSVVGFHCPEADLLREARTFAAGLLVEGPVFGTSREWPRDELKLLAGIVQAQRTFAHPYVMLGEMLPAPHLEDVPMIEATMLGSSRDTPVGTGFTRVAGVVASGWKSPTGRTGYVFASALDRPTRPKLAVGRGGGWVKVSAGGRAKLAARDGKVEVPLGPLEVALVEEERTQ